MINLQEEKPEQKPILGQSSVFSAIYCKVLKVGREKTQKGVAVNPFPLSKSSQCPQFLASIREFSASKQAPDGYTITPGLCRMYPLTFRQQVLGHSQLELNAYTSLSNLLSQASWVNLEHVKASALIILLR
uniref:Uncharacterized protein n=1 Tax=Opuntia streptacantha TaxID=393608 RepID=A0A7C8YGU2_OPUST